MEEKLITKNELDNHINCIKDKYSKYFNSIKDDSLDNFYMYPDNCLKDIKYIVKVFFKDLHNIIKTQEYTNSEDELLGYSIIVEFKALDDNKNQYTQYIKFTLAYKYMSIIESENLEWLKGVNNKAEDI